MGLSGGAREAGANLLFALTAVATSLLAAGEVWMMWAETPEQFGLAVRCGRDCFTPRSSIHNQARKWRTPAP